MQTACARLSNRGGCGPHLQHAAVEVPDVEVQAGERF